MESGDILGHGNMGEVIEVGSEITNLKVGDRVVVPFTISCGQCWSCKHTRITEYKHLTGQVHPRTAISCEVARAEGNPFYPIPRAENRELYRCQEALA